MTASGKTVPRKALIVEDDSAFGEIFKRVLRTVQFESDWVTSVEAARSLLSTRRYDAYILDLGLPDNAMGELIDLVRDCDPDAARKSAIVTAFPTVARALAGEFPVIDKASMRGLKEFLSSLGPTRS